ncbi:hypothetical protein [Alkalicoccus chagannorensis]|uniref:DUF7916 family protein n=1 Tax=Alkalicoccus chagannorensis TaxID=427072 RepID=UPI0003F65796|nr:hypothetical protein [Alkalicoccus chagannorensis]
MKRLLSSTSSELLAMTGQELKQAVRASEGRTILAEVLASTPPVYPEMTNGELAAAFGADLLLLNGYDVLQPDIHGLHAGDHPPMQRFREWTGRPTGINLEPVDPDAAAAETLQTLPEGRTVSERTLREAASQGIDFLCLTGNPQTGVTNRQITDAVKKARRLLGEEALLIAGKMHGAGVQGDVVSPEQIAATAAAGADVILLPAPGTVPGVTVEKAAAWAAAAAEQEALVMMTIGTSQEGADPAAIRQIGLWNKMAGADIHHIGDAGLMGIAEPENILHYSTTIRGRRHTMLRMGRSIRR